MSLETRSCINVCKLQTKRARQATQAGGDQTRHLLRRHHKTPQIQLSHSKTRSAHPSRLFFWKFGGISLIILLIRPPNRCVNRVPRRLVTGSYSGRAERGTRTADHPGSRSADPAPSHSPSRARPPHRGPSGSSLCTSRRPHPASWKRAGF